MPEHDNKREQTPPAAAATPPRGDETDAVSDPDAAREVEADAQKSSTSRPRGHTEDPDRTL